MAGALAPVRSDPSHAGIFLDLDGTLADIVARPELAGPVPQARAVLRGLCAAYALVAVVSGRTSDEVARLVDVPRVEVFGLYGLEGDTESSPSQAVRAEVERAAGEIGGSWVEDKGLSLAVHFRAAADPTTAERRLEESLGPIAERFGMTILPGKRVLELAPAHTPGKGAVVLREARDRELHACLYAGDDRADLDAFRVLDELKREDVATVKVAVRANETPEALIAAADVVVERPSGLVELLAHLLPSET